MDHFLPFYPSNSSKNQNFEKMKRGRGWPGDIIILDMCTKNYDQVMHSSWDMVRDRCNYFLFWTIFCPFIPLTAQKINILKWKKRLEISSFYICVPKIIIRWCRLPEIWCVTDVIVISHFGLLFALLPPPPPPHPPNSPKNHNFEKMKKEPGDIIILHKCTKNYDQMIYGSWDMVRDGRMDGRTEKVTYRGGCPT